MPIRTRLSAMYSVRISDDSTTALPWYEKAASLDPGNPVPAGLPADAYWELGDDAEAGRWLARTLAHRRGG